MALFQSEIWVCCAAIKSFDLQLLG